MSWFSWGAAKTPKKPEAYEPPKVVIAQPAPAPTQAQPQQQQPAQVQPQANGFASGGIFANMEFNNSTEQEVEEVHVDVQPSIFAPSHNTPRSRSDSTASTTSTKSQNSVKPEATQVDAILSFYDPHEPVDTTIKPDKKISAKPTQQQQPAAGKKSTQLLFFIKM